MDYFELRDVAPNDYATAELPAWLLGEINQAAKNSNILDFGCGFGQNLRAMKQHGFVNVYGADVSPQALKHCHTSGMHVFDIRQGFGEMENRAERFDFIVSTHVLEHIPKDEVIDVLKKLRGLLSAGGSLLVAVPNAQAYTGCYWAYEDFTHHTLYTTGSLMHILRAAGFSKVKLLDRDALVGSKFLRRAVRSLFALFYRTNYRFWKKILGSPTHISSVDVFTYELKMKATA